jgi:hypothetical protein
MGHLLVNTTIDTQFCFECEIDTYTLDMFSGCVDGVCANRLCSVCPVGVDCFRGSNLPWRHFVPKLLKIGQRTIQYATVKGVTIDHRINRTVYYELFYDNYTGDAALANSDGKNSFDYVWEYVAECTDETEPCDMQQVDAFYLRTCPRGTQLVNTTIGSDDFDLNSQQCVPCGPLNYIIDPGSGGTCQECPKVRVSLLFASVHDVFSEAKLVLFNDDFLTPCESIEALAS